MIGVKIFFNKCFILLVISLLDRCSACFLDLTVWNRPKKLVECR